MEFYKKKLVRELRHYLARVDALKDGLRRFKESQTDDANMALESLTSNEEAEYAEIQVQVREAADQTTKSLNQVEKAGRQRNVDTLERLQQETENLANDLKRKQAEREQQFRRDGMALANEVSEITESLSRSDSGGMLSTVEVGDWTLPSGKTLPLRVPFFNSASLEISGVEAAAVATEIAWRSLIDNVNMRVDVVVLSLEIQPEFAVLANAGAVRIRNYRAFSSVTEASKEIENIRRSVQDTVTLLAGRWPNLESFISQRPEEWNRSHHLLIVTEDLLAKRDTGSDKLSERIDDLIAQGPRFGVSTILVRNLPTKQRVDVASSPESLIHVEVLGTGSKADTRRVVVHLPKKESEPRPITVELLLTGSDKIADQLRAPSSRENAKPPLLALDSVLLDSESTPSDVSDALDVAIGTFASERVVLRLGNTDDGVAYHALVGGKTGSGKSVLLKTMVLGLCHRFEPSELNFFILDFKGTEFSDFAAGEGRLPHVRFVGCSDLDQGSALLESMNNEMERRQRQFVRLGVVNYSEYCKMATEPLPRWILLIDEFHRLLPRDDGAVSTVGANNGDLLNVLSRQSGSFGIHLVLATQTLEGLLGKIEPLVGQMTHRICLSVDPAISRSFIGSTDAVGLKTGYAKYMCSIGANPILDVRVASAGSSSEIRARSRRIREGLADTGANWSEARQIRRDVGADLHREWDALKSQSSSPRAVVGIPFDPNRPPEVVEFDDSPGSHLLIVGDGDDEGRGMIYSTLKSLSISSPAESRFFMVGSEREIQVAGLKALIATSFQDHRLRIVSEIDENVKVAVEDTDMSPTFVVFPSGARLQDKYRTTLKEWLQEGHSKRIHVIGWWREPPEAAWAGMNPLPNMSFLKLNPELRRRFKAHVSGSFRTQFQSRSDMKSIWLQTPNIS